MLKRGKKGFTLAELLIVVAIIAVLVAIAVPLFVSGIQKAQKARDDANVRSVKSAAVVYILDHDTNDAEAKGFTIYKTGSDGKQGDMFPYFTVVATIEEGGKITIEKIEGHTSSTGTDTVTALKKGGWKVTAYIDALEFKK